MQDLPLSYKSRVASYAGSVGKKFLKWLFIRFLLVATATVFLAAPAHALSSCKKTGVVTVSFSSGSSTLTNSSKVQLARHIPRLNAVQISIILIVGRGDKVETALNADKELSLARARAESVRQFFLDAGYQEQNFYVEGQRATVREHQNPPIFYPRLGTVEVEYIGYCKQGYEAIYDEWHKQ